MPAFTWDQFDIWVERTADYQFDLYQADAITPEVLQAVDVVRFKLWLSGNEGQAPAIDADSIADLLSATFTADAVTDALTAVAHGLSNGDAVLLTTTGTLPPPLILDRAYWVIGATANTFQLALTPGGAAIDLTGAGAGVHTFSETRSKITVNNLGTPATTPARVTVRFDQVDTRSLTAGGDYLGELTVVDDSDDAKIKPAMRGSVRVVGSAAGDLGTI